MSKHFYSGSDRGFSLIEVLVAVAILSFGFLALATLQLSVLRSSSDSKSRTVALALAKARLEQRRTYSSLTGYQAIADTTESPVTIGGIAYTPSWTVTRYVYNQDVDNDGTLNETNDQAFQSTSTETGATPTSPSGFVANNEFKVLRINVDWSDAAGVTQRVSMEDAIAALSPSDGALVAKQSTTVGVRRIPVIINDPGSDTMVIPVALGNGVNTAATNPKPQVIVGTSTVETQFDVYTYANLNGGTATAQARVETIMLGCTCEFGVVAEDATANKRPTYWDGFRYTVPLAAGYTAPAGPKASEVNNQSPRCNACCRDHHDPVGANGATFSPRLVTKNASNSVTTAHSHFVNKSTVTPVTSGAYKEACRMIRIDGIWRVAADMSNDYYGLLATGNGTTAATPVPDTTSVAGTPSVTGAVARYQKFVLGYLEGRFVTPTHVDSTAKATYNTVGTPTTLAATAPYVLDNPSSININLVDNTGKWLHSRGLYVDYIEQETVDAIKDAKQSSSCTVDASTLSACILKLLPFTSINLTELADWSPLSGNLIVTNNDYSTSLAQGNPVRGKVTSAAASASSINAVTVSRKANTSLLDLTFDSISPDDDITYSDSQPFQIGGGSPPPASGNGSFPVTISSYTGTNTPSVSYFTTGTASTFSCGLSAGTYTCSVTNGSASVGLDVAGGMSIDVGNYNHQQASSGQTSPKLTGCTSTQGLAGILNSDQATNAPGVLQPYTGSVCKNYQVTAVTTTNPSPGTISWTASPSSAGDGRVNPAPGEVTRITFGGTVSSTAPNSVTVTLGLESTNAQTASSCTYTCGQVQSGACKSNKPTTFQAIFPACP